MEEKKAIDNLQKFGPMFQVKCIACLLSDQTFIERIYDIIEPTYFEAESQQWIVREIIDYFVQYKALPTADVFKIAMDGIPNPVLKTAVNDSLHHIYANKSSSDIDFVKKEFLKFCQNQKMSKAILDSVPLLERGEYEQIYNIVGTAMNAGKERNIGHNYLQDIDLRMSNICRKSIPTGWPLIDEIMDGGLAAGELGVVTACAGSGKCVGPDTVIEIEYEEKGYKLTHFEYVSTYIYIDPFQEQECKEELTLSRNKTEIITMKELFSRLKVEDKENAIKNIDFDLKVKTPEGFQKIKTAFRTEKQKTLTLYFDNNINLKTSEKHKLMNDKKKWVFSKDIKVGDKIKTETGYASLVKVEKGDEEVLYDISVEKTHCYYSNGLLSHNSWILAKIGSEAMKQGQNVLHITLELNENYVGIRYDSCFTGVDFQNIKDNVSIVKQRLSQIPGKLIIKYFPIKTINPNDIKLHIDRLNMCGFKTDLLIVDYADILCSRFAQKNSNSYSEAGSIYEELRGVAGELKIPCWTASQSSRSAMDSDIIQADTIADSYRKIMTADFVLSLSRKMEDKLCNTARFHVIKNRFGPDGVTFPAKLNASCGKVELFSPKSPEGMALLRGMQSSENTLKQLLKDRIKNNAQTFDD